MDQEIRTVGKLKIAEPLDQALARTRDMLFAPFDVTRWVCLGVIIFLDVLMGGASSSMLSFGRTDLPESFEDFESAVKDFLPDLEAHWAVIMGIAGVVLFAYLLWTVLVTWLGSRGQLMFIRAVADDDVRVSVNWSQTRSASGSLFLFRLTLKFISLGATVGAVIFAVLRFKEALAQEEFDLLLFVIWQFPILIAWFTVFASILIIDTMLRDFVAPIMYAEHVSCIEAWRLFGRALRGNIIAFHIFYLVRFVISIVLGTATFLLGCFTCFIGAIPIIQQTALAPLYVFDRAFSLYALQSMTPDLEIMLPPPPPPPLDSDADIGIM